MDVGIWIAVSSAVIASASLLGTVLRSRGQMTRDDIRDVRQALRECESDKRRLEQTVSAQEGRITRLTADYAEVAARCMRLEDRLGVK
jgi:Fe-S cluster assembly scaffold protein SufB